ncbi:MAG: hypothetical protein AAFX10_01615 [Pseudomonadota bacterium]
MRKASVPGFMTLILLLATACGGDEQASEPTGQALTNDSAPVVTFTPESDAPIALDGDPAAPLSIAYRVIGTPVVGQPIAIDIQVLSSLGDHPVTVNYRITDATAMELAEAQPESVMLTPDGDDAYAPRQVTVIPKRPGRIYLNVQAGIDTRDGSLSTATAIPLEVSEAT